MEYITNDEYRRQKSALTRAVNSGDPVQVLKACEKVLDAWENKAWPDAWSRWSVALYDAWLKYERYVSDPRDPNYGRETDSKVIERFHAAYHTFG